MQVEDGLASAGTDVDDDLVVLEARGASGICDEFEHAKCLVRPKLADVAERLDVPLGNHEQVRVCLRVDVLDRDEAARRVDVLATLVELAEEAVFRQRGSPPP